MGGVREVNMTPIMCRHMSPRPGCPVSPYVINTPDDVMAPRVRHPVYKTIYKM